MKRSLDHNKIKVLVSKWKTGKKKQRKPKWPLRSLFDHQKTLLKAQSPKLLRNERNSTGKKPLYIRFSRKKKKLTNKKRNSVQKMSGVYKKKLDTKWLQIRRQIEMIKMPSDASFPSILPSDLLPTTNALHWLIHNIMLGIKGKQHLLDTQLFRIQRSRHEISKYQAKLHELDKDVSKAWLRHINEDHADASLFIKGNRMLLCEVGVDLKLMKKRIEAVHSMYMTLPGRLNRLNNQAQHEKYKQWMHAYKTLMVWILSIFGIFILVPLAFNGSFLNCQ